MTSKSGEQFICTPTIVLTGSAVKENSLHRNLNGYRSSELSTIVAINEKTQQELQSAGGSRRAELTPVFIAVSEDQTIAHLQNSGDNGSNDTCGGEVGARMKGHRMAQPELSEGRPILMPHLAACHLSTWQGFDPRPHLANFHPIAGATPPPPPLQHPEDQKNKIANRNATVKPQSQATTNDFSAARNLAPVVPTSVAYTGVDASKIPSSVVEKQEPEALKDKLWPCPSCKVPFKAASELQAHLSAHTKGEKTVPCEICGKLFASIERVRIHIRAAHGEKSCSCDICGSGFSYRCKLLDHMRTHTGDKPFHCDICGKSFSQKNHLTRHSMIHTGERPYPCDFCGRGFYRKDKLTRHRRIHTVAPSTTRHNRALGQGGTNRSSNSSTTTSNLTSTTSNSSPITSNSNPIITSSNSKLSPSTTSPNPSNSSLNLSLNPSLHHFRTSAFKPDWQGAPSGVH